MKTHFFGALCALVLIFVISTSTNAAPVSGQGTWETTLQARDLDGNPSTAEAYYDTALNITWLADANYAGTFMNWTTANAWAAGLNPYDSGITGWRLPTTIDVGNDGCTYTNYYQGVDCGYNITTHSEMSHMFYVTLGDKADYDTSGNPQAGSGLTNTGPFANIQYGENWSATEWATDPSGAWIFSIGLGIQDGLFKANIRPAWAVHSGDVGVAVSSVPLPTAFWLFGSGLVGLLGFVRRSNKN